LTGRKLLWPAREGTLVYRDKGRGLKGMQRKDDGTALAVSFPNSSKMLPIRLPCSSSWLRMLEMSRSIELRDLVELNPSLISCSCSSLAGVEQNPTMVGTCVTSPPQLRLLLDSVITSRLGLLGREMGADVFPLKVSLKL